MEALCPSCLARQAPGERCGGCGGALRLAGLRCEAMLGVPSTARLSFLAARDGERRVLRLQRLRGDGPDALRTRARQLAAASALDGVESWTLHGVIERDGAPHWVLSRPWIEGVPWSVRAGAPEHDGSSEVAHWLRALRGLLRLGGIGVHLSHRASNLIQTPSGLVVVDLVVEGGAARSLSAQSVDLAELFSATLTLDRSPALRRTLRRLRGGAFDEVDALEAALRHGLGAAAPPAARPEAAHYRGSSRPPPPLRTSRRGARPSRRAPSWSLLIAIGVLAGLSLATLHALRSSRGPASLGAPAQRTQR